MSLQQSQLQQSLRYSVLGILYLSDNTLPLRYFMYQSHMCSCTVLHQVLHSVWSAFFTAWSAELNILCGGDTPRVADETMRLAEELTSRRQEAIAMRDGIQRLMRDQVDRMLQVPHLNTGCVISTLLKAKSKSPPGLKCDNLPTAYC